jgi:hypothetical protein
MDQGVKLPGNKGQYKNITGGEIARPKTTADQEQQPTKNNTTTPPTTSHQEHHHS